MTPELSQKSCKPCEGEVEAMTPEQIQPLREQLPAGWEVIDHHHLHKTYEFDDFQQALRFTNHIGQIAEAESHHPDIFLTWGKVKVQIFTHSIDGLSENDFILASKFDKPPEG